MGQLYSFTPNGGSEFVLPIVISEQRSLQLSTGLIVPIAEGIGSVLGAGKNALNPQAGIIAVTFAMTPNALIARSYSGNQAGLETWKIDFANNVLAAGEGTLKEKLPTGTTNGSGGATITYRTTPAIVSVDPTGQAPEFTDYWELTATFLCRTCYWQNSDSSYTAMAGI